MPLLLGREGSDLRPCPLTSEARHEVRSLSVPRTGLSRPPAPFCTGAPGAGRLGTALVLRRRAPSKPHCHRVFFPRLLCQDRSLGCGFAR